MANKQRWLYPKQKIIEPSGYDYEAAQSSLTMAGCHTIAVNDTEADSYLPRTQSPLPNKIEGDKVPQSNESEEGKIEKELSNLNKLNLDGFSSLAEATSWFGRILWITLILIVLSLLTLEIIKTVNDFVHNKVITTYTVTRSESMKFPILYICPANFLNVTYYKNHLRESATADSFFEVSLFNQSDTKSTKGRPKRDTLVEFLSQEIENPSWQNELFALNGFEKGQFDYDDDVEWSSEVFDEERKHDRIERAVVINNTIGNITIQTSAPPLNMTKDQVYDFMLNVGLNKSQVFLSCKFYEKGQHRPLPCEQIVEDVVDINYGKCYKVSVGDKLQMVEARGLSMIIDTFRSKLPKVKTLGTKRYDGVALAVHYDSVNPTSWEKIMIGGGNYLNLEVALEHVQLISVDRDDFRQPCIENDEQIMDVLNVTYSQTACQMDCFMKQIVDKCHCLLMMDRSAYFTNLLDQNSFCSKQDGINCIIPKITLDDEVSEEVENCKTKCFVRCDTWRYKVNPSRMSLNPLAFNDLPPNVNFSDLLQLDISYSRLEYVEFSQSFQTTLDTFIGNLGGQITGWVGGSMLTLINIPIMMSTWILHRSMRAKKILFKQSSEVEKTVVGFQRFIQAKHSEQKQ